MNDYLMIGISAGTPALACLLGYLLLTGFQVSGFKFQARQAEELWNLDSSHWTFNRRFVLPAPSSEWSVSGLMAGCSNCRRAVVFWVLVEMARISPLPTSGHPLSKRARGPG
jgi:hypothetical protein